MKRSKLVLGAVVLVLVAVATGGAAYLASRNSTLQHRDPAACAKGPVSRALVAKNPQLESIKWHLVSYACSGDWAAAAIYARSVGHGEAFLRWGGSGWVSDPVNGGIYRCTDLRTAFVAPEPPQALALRLFRKVGLCRAQGSPAPRPVGA